MKLNQAITQKWLKNRQKGTGKPSVDDLRRAEELTGKTIVVHTDRCTGCGSCVSVCATRRDHMGDRKMSSIRVLSTEARDRFFPVSCSQCREAPCVAVCPGEVLARRCEYGIITVDEARCTSCGSCLLSCPFEVLHVGGRRLAAEPCDLCGGEPQCVSNCAKGAMELVEITGEIIEAKRRLSDMIETARDLPASD